MNKIGWALDMKNPPIRMARMVVAVFALSLGVEMATADERFNSRRFLTFEHEEIERKYLLYLPDDLPDKAPLVFMLHGYRGDARDYTELGMNRLAEAKRFAVCYPQGEKDDEGIPHWNARLKISKTDDVEFLSALAAQLQKRHALDPGKTFASGISNGGFMSYVLVAEKPEIFKAAASVIGTMSGYTWRHREGIQPVPILQISCLDDRIIPYDGSMSPAGGWGGAPNQDVVVKFWTNLNETKAEEVVELSRKTTAHFYKGGIHGNEVWHYQVKGFGHRVPGKKEMGVDSVDVIWQFFSKFPKGKTDKRPVPTERQQEPAHP
ncbi:MAG: alpha/beta hydrolase family esterase [Verrucomicrobiales bacterium]